MKILTTARAGLTVALVVAAAGLGVLSGCGRSSQPGFGNVELIVAVPAGVDVDVFEFQLNEDGRALAPGSIETPRPQREATRLVTHVPTSDDDQIVVTAMSTDGLEGCSGSAELSVVKNATTRVHVNLVCHGSHDGVVNIKIGVTCPATHLVTYTIAPLSASVGNAIDVSAIDQDPDAGVLQYEWTATTGAYADPSAATTTYRCTAPGVATMTLLVSSDLCQETHTIGVTCFGDAGQPAD